MIMTQIESGAMPQGAPPLDIDQLSMSNCGLMEDFNDIFTPGYFMFVCDGWRAIRGYPLSPIRRL